MSDPIRSAQQSPAAVFSGMVQAIARLEGRRVESQEALSNLPGEDLKSLTDSTHPSIADEPAGIAEPPLGPIESAFVGDAPRQDARIAGSKEAFSELDAFNNLHSTHAAAGRCAAIETAARAPTESASVMRHNLPQKNRQTPNKPPAQNVEILEPSRVVPAPARALVPVAMPGRVAFAKFLASMDPSLAEHRQDEISTPD